MATLYFKIGADYENVIRLRDEIKKLENQLRSFGKSTPETQIRQTEERLATTRQEFVRLTTEAAKAGAVMESDFKKKIYDASQTVNDLSEKIIAQRTVVREVQADVKRLGEAYRTALKTNPIGASGMKTEYNAARKVLDEERAALFGLTQQQANARLSVKKLRDEYNLFKDESGDVKDAIGDIAGQMKNWVAGIAGGIGLKEFLGQLIQVRGEFENIETSLKVLLGGDSEKLADIMSQMKEYALISPLTTKDMASALQMMIGFGIQADDAITYLKALGDISMGDTVHFNSLALAFSQMSAAGKLMGQDLNQMINAGFNPLQQISEKTGKSIGELKDEMSKGAISAQMVQQAFIDATSAGGKFYGMAAEGAKTINGQISMLQESIDNMFNDMGQASEGVILSSIQAITKLVENYDKVGAVLIGLVATYGSYRAALLASMALEEARNGTLLTTIKNTKLATAAQNLFNKTVKAHPYALIASLAIGAATAIYALVKRTDEVSASQQALDEVSKNYNATIKSEQAEIDRLFDALRNAKEGTGEYQKAKDDILSKYGQYLNGLDNEISTLRDVEGAYKAVTAAARESARARAIESATSKAQEIYGETYTENASKLRDALIGQVGENRSSAILAQLRKDLQDTGKVSEQVRKQIGDALRGTFEYGTSKAWLTGLERSEKELKDAYKEIDDLFKETEKPKAEKSSTLLEDYNEAAKAYETAQKQLDEINANRDNYTAKQYEEAVATLKKAKSDFEKLGGETQTDKQRKSAAAKVENERKKEAEKRKKAQEELDKALLALRQKNQDDEIALMQEGTQKRLAEIKNDYAKRIAEIGKQEAEFKKKNEEAGATGLTGGLTKDQQTALKEARNNAAKQQRQDTEKAIKEEREAHEQSWRDYFKEYGDYQQKRAAITEDYNKKIADATKEGDEGLAKSLSAQLDAALSELDFSEFQKAINWDAVFGDLSSLPTSALSTLRSQLEAVRGSLSGGGGLSADDTEQLRTLTEAIDRLRSAEIADNPFAALRQGVAEYAQSLRELNDAQAAFDAASSQSYDGTQTLAEAFDEAIKAQDGAKMAAVENKEVTIEQTDEFGNVTSVTMRYIDALRQLQAAQNSVSASSSKLGQAINGIGSNMGHIAQIGANATELFASLGIEVPDSIGKALGGLGEMGAAMEAFDVTKPGSFLNVNNYINFAKGVVGAFEGIGEAIGGLFGLGGADYSEYYDMKAKYDQLSEVWDELISKKREYIDIDYGIEAQKAGAEALELLSQQEAYARKMADAAAGAGSSIGSHSIAYRQNRDLGGYLGELRTYMGADNQGEALTQTLIAASAEELREVREGMYQMWMGLDGDFRSALEERIAVLEEQEEVLESMKDAITGTTFDTFYDSYVDMLADMNTDNQDLADNFEDYLRKSILSSLVADKYKEKIRGLYDTWTELGKDGISKGDAELLQQMQQELSESMLADRESLAETFGWNGGSSQSGSQGTFQTMSQEQADELSGRFTAVYEGELRIEQGVVAQTQAITEIRGTIADLSVHSARMYSIADETRSILANSYLELREINENTGAIIKPIKQIQADMAAVKQNTSRI